MGYLRRSIRLKEFDYTNPGAYFITICTHERIPFFGKVHQQKMIPNLAGEIAGNLINQIPSHFSRVRIDENVVMPNHVHILFWIDEPPMVGARHASPLPEDRKTMEVKFKGGNALPQPQIDQSFLVGATHASPLPGTSPLPNGPKPSSVGAIIGSYKSAVSRAIHISVPQISETIWQRNYYEHIVINDRELNQILEYIQNNPLQWELDRYFSIGN